MLLRVPVSLTIIKIRANSGNPGFLWQLSQPSSLTVKNTDKTNVCESAVVYENCAWAANFPNPDKVTVPLGASFRHSEKGVFGESIG